MEINAIYQETTRHFLAPVRELLDDPQVSEIMIMGHETIYYEQAGQLHRFAGRFRDELTLMSAVRNIAEFVGREIDEDHHSMDARLPTGERIHAIIPPAARNGICLTIRKFQRAYYSVRKMVENGVLSAAAAEFLELAVVLHKNIVVAGGTGTGKTTMLNALSTAIPVSERVIVIEDSSELQLQQPHAVYLEAQPGREDGSNPVTIRDLFADSLRMRPDRIVVGEVRRGEALDLIQSMISGHAGALTTVHANRPRDAVSRLETLCLMSDTGLPVYVARAQVASAVDLVVQLARFSDGSRRVVEISECLGLDEQSSLPTYTWNPLFVWAQRGRNRQGVIEGELGVTGNRASFAAEVQQFGLQDRIQASQQLFS